MLDMNSSLRKSFRSTVKVVGHRKVKNVFLVISRRRIVVEIRDWCQNVGDLFIWHFGLWPIVSKIARGQSSDPRLKMRRIAFFAVSVYIRLHISVICNPIVQHIIKYVGYAACKILQSLRLLLFIMYQCPISNAYVYGWLCEYIYMHICTFLCKKWTENKYLTLSYLICIFYDLIVIVKLF